ncbi:DUF922 domain-containing Zn-dependent protease [Luteimonas salinilitoris]|uniref:DUF922 domain-containing Zn-dependent protease n=1 Tax=Luteimonas salinilitoris TaxID=3237697 RepID=A0ABV4HVZ2_9GAMM
MKHVAICLFALFFWNELRASEPLNVEFYEVRGNNARDLRKELGDHGPVGDDGSRHHGYTKWHVDWTFQLIPSGKLCAIGSVETKLEVTMTLPKWNKPEGLLEDLTREWERYSTALRLHEDGHYNIAVSAAQEIERRLSGLTGTAGCKTLAEDINSKARAVIEEFRAKDLGYDVATEHGATQGARF